MIDRAAFFAPTSPPETGASTLATPFALAASADLAGQRRLARRHVHQDGARPGCRPAPRRRRGRPRARPRGSRRWRRPRRTARPPPSACRPRRPRRRAAAGLVAAAVVDRRRVALGHQVLAHPAAHDAGADPADARLAGFRLGDRHGVPRSAQREASRRISASVGWRCRLRIGYAAGLSDVAGLRTLPQTCRGRPLR